MIFWRGLGFLIPVAAVPAYLLAEFAGGLINANPDLENILFYLIAAPVCLILGIAVKVYRKSTCEVAEVEDEKTGKVKRMFIKRKTDSETGESSGVIIKDTFMFIPMMLWPVVCIILGIFVFLF